MELDLKTTYVTSDLHFFHKNIIKYCNRPYEQNQEGIDKMNEDLLQEIDRLPPGSLLINNGDIEMGCSDFDKIYKLVQRMKENDKKVWIIMGNHDRSLKRFVKSGEMKFESSQELLEFAGFDLVTPAPILINDKFIFSHEPIRISGDFINVHGHTHDKDPDWESLDNPPQDHYYNVCWDKLHKIVTLGDIIKSF